MVNGEPAVIEAVPLLSVAPPRLMITYVACAFEPIISVPKFRLPGVTESCAGVTAEPRTVLVALPPPLEKRTTLLKPAAFVGAKLTRTTLVCPPSRMKGLPLATRKGNVVVTVPVKERL